MFLSSKSWALRQISPLIRKWYPHGAVRRVWRGPAAGTRFEVINGMGLTYALGLDYWHFQFLKKKIKPGMVIYDVGANCGQMTLFFAKAAGSSGRILAFEPVPENARRLRRNLHLNSFFQAELFETAVGTDTEPKRFCLNAGNHTAGTLANTANEGQIWDTELEVSCLTLDGLTLMSPPPDLIKIDVEGGGGGVISGAMQILEKHRPLLYFELHAGAEDAQELQALRLLRDQFGYQFIGLDAPGEALRPSWGHALWGEPPVL